MDIILNKFTFLEYNILGSASDKQIKFASDIDVESFNISKTNEIKDYNKILKHFQHYIYILKKNKDIYFLDFKAGNFINNVPLKWTEEDILRGYTIIEDTKKYFIDILQKPSIIKIDLLVKTNNNNYEEISVNYYFTFGDYSTSTQTQDTSEISKSLYTDFKNYIKKEDYYKALKRLYSYYKINNKDIKPILKILNSKYGLYYTYINNLDIILKLIELNINNKDIMDYINNIINNISEQKFISIFQSIKNNLDIDLINNSINNIKQLINNKIKNKINKLKKIF